MFCLNSKPTRSSSCHLSTLLPKRPKVLPLPFELCDCGAKERFDHALYAAVAEQPRGLLGALEQLPVQIQCEVDRGRRGSFRVEKLQNSSPLKPSLTNLRTTTFDTLTPKIFEFLADLFQRVADLVAAAAYCFATWTTLSLLPFVGWPFMGWSATMCSSYFSLSSSSETNLLRYQKIVQILLYRPPVNAIVVVYVAPDFRIEGF